MQYRLRREARGMKSRYPWMNWTLLRWENYNPSLRWAWRICCNYFYIILSFSLKHISLYYYGSQEHNTANAKKKSNVATKEGAVGSRKPRKEKAAPVDRAPGSSAAPKKAISNSSSVSVSGLYATGAHSHGSPGDDQHTGGDMMDSIEEDDMFFSNESFDDLRAQAAENGNSDASGQW